jgi:hypothetical protein
MEYVMALMREIEIYINDKQARIALEARLVQMKKETVVKMIEDEDIPSQSDLIQVAETFDVRGIVHRGNEKRMEHVNTVREVSRITIAFGFILRDMKCELLTRIIEEIILDNSLVKALGYDKIPGGKKKPGWISAINDEAVERHGIGEKNEILIGEAIRYMKNKCNVNGDTLIEKNTILEAGLTDKYILDGPRVKMRTQRKSRNQLGKPYRDAIKIT